MQHGKIRRLTVPDGKKTAKTKLQRSISLEKNNGT
jgi:hypothetical protein